MKVLRNLLAALLLALPAILLAENVSQEKALATAKQFFGSAVRTSADNELHLVWNGENSLTKAATAPAFYVFERNGGGFVIIAGDDCISPIIGYSRTNRFKTDGMPSNVAAWFAEIRSFVNDCRSKSLVDPKAASEWESVGSARRQAYTENLLNTAKWGQDEPFNAKCPSGSPTGCVAIAMGIMMKYFQYPAAGNGTIPAYVTTTNKYSIPANTLGTKYQWDKMPLVIDKSASGETAEQVSRLIYDCATSVHMDFMENASSAYVTEIPTALVQFFGFDKGATLKLGKDYSESQWLSMVKAEIDAKRPVMYGGESKDGGHRFIVEGYDSDGKFMLNFGWYGYQNGYYTFPNFNDFTTGHNAVFNVKPDAGGSYEEIFRVEYKETTDKGLTTSAPAFADNISFDVTVNGIIYNFGYADYKGELGIARCDSNGKFIEMMSSGYETETLKQGTGYVGATFPCSLKKFNDNDRIQVVFKTSAGEWKPAIYDMTSTTFKGAIVLKHGESESAVADATSLAFDPKTKKVTIKTMADATATLKNSKGADYSSAMSVSSGTITINSATLPKDNYILGITVKGIGSYKITIKAGK